MGGSRIAGDEAAFWPPVAATFRAFPRQSVLNVNVRDVARSMAYNPGGWPRSGDLERARNQVLLPQRGGAEPDSFVDRDAVQTTW